MAKQQVIEMENGSVLIYQKQNSFNGASFVIGFRSGAQLDGKYKGISHLLEHLLFDGTTDDLTKNINDQILKHTINQNAFTSFSCIASTFSATHNHLESSLDNVMHTLTKKDFTQAQIKKEADVVKQEIYMYRDSHGGEVVNAKKDLLLNLLQTEEHGPLNLLGTERTLKMVTPELLKKYMDRYFNLDNLVISVTTNKSLNETIKLLEEKVYSKFERASDEKYIVPYEDITTLRNENLFLAYPDNASKTVNIALVLKEREDRYSDDINKEYAFDTIEEYLMNNSGGIMFEKLRVTNRLVYNYNLQNIEIGMGKFKMFNATTNKSKMRKTVKTLCNMIYEISQNGFPKEKFEDVKKALTDLENASLNKFKPCSAKENFDDYLEGTEFIDYKTVMKYIKEMTYEEFNSYVSGVYKKAKVSMSIDGDFDSRDCYSLIEVEEMLGNYTNSKYKANLNAPISQFTVSPASDPILNLLQNAVISQEVEDEEKIETIKIDDKKLFEDLNGKETENIELGRTKFKISEKERFNNKLNEYINACERTLTFNPSKAQFFKKLKTVLKNNYLTEDEEQNEHSKQIMNVLKTYTEIENGPSIRPTGGYQPSFKFKKFNIPKEVREMLNNEYNEITGQTQERNK